MARNRRQTRGRLHGIIVIDKPAGWTSHDVVARIRRLTGERRVGHAGTLDPAATGVLPVLVGDATRVVEFLSDADKAYRAEVTFGVRTDSGDIDGSVIDTSPERPDRDELERCLDGFRGDIEQTPPMHSAVKVGGMRLYEAARRGEVVDRQPRSVRISTLDLREWAEPVAMLDVVCSKGTYIRSLATDLGDRVGCCAYLSNLVRTRTGPFTLTDAWTLTQLAEAGSGDIEAEWEAIAHHPDAILADWPAIALDDAARERWYQGRAPAPLQGTPSHAGPGNGGVRAYDADGTWLGIGRLIENEVRPWKVASSGAQSTAEKETA